MKINAKNVNYTPKGFRVLEKNEITKENDWYFVYNECDSYYTKQSEYTGKIAGKFWKVIRKEKSMDIATISKVTKTVVESQVTLKLNIEQAAYLAIVLSKACSPNNNCLTVYQNLVKTLKIVDDNDHVNMSCSSQTDVKSLADKITKNIV